jgi:hypothetical protein
MTRHPDTESEPWSEPQEHNELPSSKCSNETSLDGNHQEDDILSFTPIVMNHTQFNAQLSSGGSSEKKYSGTGMAADASWLSGRAWFWELRWMDTLTAKEEITGVVLRGVLIFLALGIMVTGIVVAGMWTGNPRAKTLAKGDKLPVARILPRQLPEVAEVTPDIPWLAVAMVPIQPLGPVATVQHAAQLDKEPETEPEAEPDQPVVPPSFGSRDHRSRRGSTDICRGKGRYYTHGGKSWRCNR